MNADPSKRKARAKQARLKSGRSKKVQALVRHVDKLLKSKRLKPKPW